MAILSALAGPIAGALFTALAGILTGWIRSQQDQATGAQAASLAVAQASAKTVAAEAQAEASAPRTQAALVASLGSDSF